jgi:hypothetical protein
MYDIAGNFLKDEGYKKFTRLLYDFFPKRDSDEAARLEKTRGKKIIGTKPSLKLNDYTGSFTDKMYGDIDIKQKDGDYQITFEHTPLFTGILKHWHYETFEIIWDAPQVLNGFLTFEFDTKRNITGFKLDLPNLLDVDFSELEIKKKRQ